MFKKFCIGLLCVVLGIVCVSCKHKADISLNENIKLTSDNSQPLLKVYDVESKSIVEMPLEEYLLGVLAGEMYNDWPLESLKAQAVLARTYSLYFLQNYKSKYEGADISNDVLEAQAYNKNNINENVKKAVEETKGLVVTFDGELIESWFHSNSGGVTTTAKNGLNFKGEEGYTKIGTSPENSDNSQNFNWGYSFSKAEVLSAFREMGITVNSINDFAIKTKDNSGRVLSFECGGSEISANTFRQKIGTTKLKSTLITDIIVSSNSIYFDGKGYGHGVGMSQWGAKILAEQGKNFEEILHFYFADVEISKYKISK